MFILKVFVPKTVIESHDSAHLLKRLKESLAALEKGYLAQCALQDIRQQVVTPMDHSLTFCPSHH